MTNNRSSFFAANKTKNLLMGFLYFSISGGLLLFLLAGVGFFGSCEHGGTSVLSQCFIYVA